MLQLIKCEWIKLCRKRITLITTACCFIGSIIFFSLPFIQYQVWDENGNMISRGDAVSYSMNIYNTRLPGVLTEERVFDDIQEYQKKFNDPNNIIQERGGRVSFKDSDYYEYYAPIKPYLAMIGNVFSNNGNGSINLQNIENDKAAHFYQARQATLLEHIENNENLNATEKAYWKEKALSVDIPFEYGYHLGWSEFGKTTEMLIICMLGICIAIASIFADEYRYSTDSVILSSRFGKNKLIRAKIITAFLFATVVYVLNAVVALAIPLLTFGTGGGNLPVQIYLPMAPYAVTFGQATIMSLAIAYVVLIGLVSFTLFLSAKVKTSFATLGILVFFIFIPIFLHFDKWTALFPLKATSGPHLLKYNISYSVKSLVVNHFNMIAITYIFAFILFIPLAYRAFKCHQKFR